MAGSLNTTTPDNKVGAMTLDARQKPMPIVGYWTYEDATGTPKVSPVALTNGAVTTITLPTGCIGISLGAELDDILYGDNANLTGTTGQTTGKGSDLVFEGTKDFIPTAGMTSIKMRARNDAANAWIKYGFPGSAA